MDPENPSPHINASASDAHLPNPESIPDFSEEIDHLSSLTQDQLAQILPTYAAAQGDGDEGGRIDGFDVQEEAMRSGSGEGVENVNADMDGVAARGRGGKRARSGGEQDIDAAPAQPSEKARGKRRKLDATATTDTQATEAEGSSANNNGDDIAMADAADAQSPHSPARSHTPLVRFSEPTAGAASPSAGGGSGTVDKEWLMNAPIGELSEEQKKDRLREANRLAALRSRGKKRGEIALLEQTVSSIQAENTKLRAKLESLLSAANIPIPPQASSSSNIQNQNQAARSESVQAQATPRQVEQQVANEAAEGGDGRGIEGGVHIPELGLDLDEQGRDAEDGREGDLDPEDLIAQAQAQEPQGQNQDQNQEQGQDQQEEQEDDTAGKGNDGADADLGLDLHALDTMRQRIDTLKSQIAAKKLAKSQRQSQSHALGGESSYSSFYDAEKSSLLAHIKWLKGQREEIEMEKRAVRREIEGRRVGLEGRRVLRRKRGQEAGVGDGENEDQNTGTGAATGVADGDINMDPTTASDDPAVKKLAKDVQKAKDDEVRKGEEEAAIARIMEVAGVGSGVERALLEVRGWLDGAVRGWRRTGILPSPASQNTIPYPSRRHTNKATPQTAESTSQRNGDADAQVDPSHRTNDDDNEIDNPSPEATSPTDLNAAINDLNAQTSHSHPSQTHEQDSPHDHDHEQDQQPRLPDDAGFQQMLSNIYHTGQAGNVDGVGVGEGVDGGEVSQVAFMDYLARAAEDIRGA